MDLSPGAGRSPPGAGRSPADSSFAYNNIFLFPSLFYCYFRSFMVKLVRNQGGNLQPERVYYERIDKENQSRREF